MIDVAKILQVNIADITSKYRSLWLNTFGIKEGEQADEFKEKLNLILSEEEHAILWSAINMRMLVSIALADQIHALVKPTVNKLSFQNSQHFVSEVLILK